MSLIRARRLPISLCMTPDEDHDDVVDISLRPTVGQPTPAPANAAAGQVETSVRGAPRNGDTSPSTAKVNPNDARTDQRIDRAAEHGQAAEKAPHSSVNMTSATTTGKATPAATTRRRVRGYKLHQGSNRFCCAGWCMTSGDNLLPSIVSFSLAFFVPSFAFAFTSDFVWHEMGAGGKAALIIFAYLVALMWVNMGKAAWSDPGIVPRELNSVPERKWETTGGGAGQGGWRAQPKYLRIGEAVVASKWCETCHTYRPPRTSHCRLCDNCCETTDHHCTFLNNCIGRRNYLPFIVFLVSAVLCCIWAICFCSYLVAKRKRDRPALWPSEWEEAGSIAVAALAFLLLCPIGGLLLYHLRLIAKNATTIEMLRPKAERGGIDPATGEPVRSPFAHDIAANIASRLCLPLELESTVRRREMLYVPQ